MDIGEEGDAIIVEPIEDPFVDSPGCEPEAEPATETEQVPA